MRVRIQPRLLTEMAGWRSSPSRRANCRARNTAPEEQKNLGAFLKYQKTTMKVRRYGLIRRRTKEPPLLAWGRFVLGYLSLTHRSSLTSDPSERGRKSLTSGDQTTGGVFPGCQTKKIAKNRLPKIVARSLARVFPRFRLARRGAFLFFLNRDASSPEEAGARERDLLLRRRTRPSSALRPARGTRAKGGPRARPRRRRRRR